MQGKLLESYTSFIVIDGILHRLQHPSEAEPDSDAHAVPVVPRHLRDQAVLEAHESLGHPGIGTTFNFCRQYFWFRGMQPHIKDIVQPCEPCAFGKHGKVPGDKLGVIHKEEVNRGVALDIGDISGNNNGPARYVVVMTDLASHYVVCAALRQQNGSSIAHAFHRSWCQIFGMPNYIRHDQGANFMGGAFANYCRFYNIEQRPTIPGNPRADGSAERGVALVKETTRVVMLQLQQGGHPKVAWHSMLQEVTARINQRPRSDSKLSRAGVFFARPIRHPTMVRLPEGQSLYRKGREPMPPQDRAEWIRAIAAFAQEEKAKRARAYFDSHSRRIELPVGSWVTRVLLRREAVTSRALSVRCSKPLMVIKEISTGMYFLRDRSGKQLKDPVPLRQLRPYYAPVRGLHTASEPALVDILAGPRAATPASPQTSQSEPPVMYPAEVCIDNARASVIALKNMESAEANSRVGAGNSPATVGGDHVERPVEAMVSAGEMNRSIEMSQPRRESGASPGHPVTAKGSTVVLTDTAHTDNTVRSSSSVSPAPVSLRRSTRTHRMPSRYQE